MSFQFGAMYRADSEFIEENVMSNAMQLSTVVDLFCGVGGLTYGFVQEGFNVVAGVDSDGSCSYAYEHNSHAKFIHRRIEDVSAADISALYPEGHLKILVGCAPCQPFSRYAQSRRSPDDKWKLLETFANLIETVQPDIVSMENVPDLLKFNGGAIYNAFVTRLERLTPTYAVSAFLVNCPEYGIPQQRKRLVVFASRLGKVRIEDTTHTKDTYQTVWHAIHELPAISAGEICRTDPLHRSSHLSEINLRRIRQSRPGGTWRDWDHELVTTCHTKETGVSYPSVYGRMTWNDPSPTITTQCHGYGNGRFGHPEQDRAISLREAALLQTFPPNYAFVALDRPVFIATVARHIGNAVPVELGRVIARSIKRHVETNEEARPQITH